MSTESKVKTGLELVRVGLDAANGTVDPVAIGKAAIDVALEFWPIEEIQAHLDAAAVARAELVADVIVEARFPRGPGGGG